MVYSFDKIDELVSISVVKWNYFHINFAFKKGKPFLSLVVLLKDSESSYCLLLSPMRTFSDVRCEFFDSVFDFLVISFNIKYWVGKNRLDDWTFFI